MVALVVSVVVGQDCPGGEIRARTTLANLKAMPRLGDLFDRFGVQPTYFLNYPAATRPEGQWFREQQDGGRCEVGVSFEPWTTPPYDANEDRLVEQSPEQFAASVVRNKLTTLTAAIESLTGRAPTAHRCTGERLTGPTLQALERLGYLVDNTTIPGNRQKLPEAWRDRESPYVPYFPDRQAPSVRGGSRVLMVPRTAAPPGIGAGLLNPLMKLGRGLIGHNGNTAPEDPLPGYRGRRLTPVHSTGEEMRALAEWSTNRSLPCLVLSIRTETLTAGMSSACTTRQEAGALWERLDEILRYLMDEMRVTPMTLSGFARHYLRGSLGPEESNAPR